MLITCTEHKFFVVEIEKLNPDWCIFTYKLILYISHLLLDLFTEKLNSPPQF